MSSNYTVAGFETLSSILNNFITGKIGNYDNHFTRENINNFFLDTCSKFLHSFGQTFGKAKKLDKHVQKEVELYEKCRNTGFFDGCEFVSDSGGFQASCGNIGKHQTNELIRLYYQFLEENHSVLDKAFILDLPPGPGCVLFNNSKEVYDKNVESYNIAKNLPKEARDKIIYVHHFRTPMLWDVYTRILKEEDMFRHFNYFGTGGIVANMASDITIPCAIYILPLIPLINQAKKYNYEHLHFHILGGANYRDILFYEFFKIHVLKKHGIQLHISYDSSSLFKGLMIGRQMFVLDNGVVRKLNIRSADLQNRFDHSRRKIDLYRQVLYDLAEKHNFKQLSIDSNNIYVSDGGTFYEDVKIYSMLYMLDMYKQMEELLRGFAEQTYKLYESGDLDDFSSCVSMKMKDLNNGKITKKQKTKSNIMIKSLDMLTNLDEDQCKHMVTKYLEKDEFVDLTRGKLLPF